MCTGIRRRRIRTLILLLFVSRYRMIFLKPSIDNEYTHKTYLQTTHVKLLLVFSKNQILYVCVCVYHCCIHWFFFLKLYTYRQLVVCSPNRTIIRIVHRWSSLCILLSRISAFALVSAIPNRVHGKCNSQQAVSSVSSVFVL